MSHEHPDEAYPLRPAEVEAARDDAAAEPAAGRGLNPFSYSPSELRKALVGFAGFVVTVLTTLLAVGNVIPTEALPYVHALIGVAASYGIFAAANHP